MLVGLKLYHVDFKIDQNYQEKKMIIEREVDISYVSDKFPSTDFSVIEDAQILEDSFNFGFIYWQSTVPINKQAWLEFFMFEPFENSTISYITRSIQVAPDIIRQSDNQVLFQNYHFELFKDYNMGYFNYLDPDYNLMSLEFKIMMNIHN